MTRETLISLAGKAVTPPSKFDTLTVDYLRDWSHENGCVCFWGLCDHYGTHVDAPFHVVPGGPTIDQIDITRLCGEAVVLDCTFATGRGLSGEHLERAADGVDLRRGDIVLLHSADPPITQETFLVEQTHVVEGGAEWLVDRGVASVGVEVWSFEHFYEALNVHYWYEKTTPTPHWPAHQIVLRAGCYIIEGLSDLSNLLGRRIGFSALPLPVPGSSGSPVRAVAWELT
jgi:kynurenine formamidase